MKSAVSLNIMIIQLIKHIFAEEANELYRKDMMSELSLMKRLSPHKNVIQLLACITESGITHCSYTLIFLSVLFIIVVVVDCLN